MKRRFVTLGAVVLALFLLVGCGEEDQMREDLTTTLDALITQDGREACYLYQAGPLQAQAPDSPVLNDVKSKVTYEIGEMGDGTATVRFTTPDLLQILQSCAEAGAADTQDLLDAAQQKLQGDYPTREYAVTVRLQKVEDHWYLVPDTQLEDVLSGGIIEGYTDQVSDWIDEMEGANR